MATDTDIANGALVRLGQRLILDIDEVSKEARVCKQRLPLVKLALLEMHPWSFATKRVVLTPDTVEPAHTYENQFSLPTDFLRFANDKRTEEDDEFKVESGKILSQHETLSIRYIQSAPEIRWWTPLAVNACSLYLAWDICYFLVEANNLREQLWSELTSANGLLAKAKWADSTRTPFKQAESELVQSAYGRQRYPRDPMT